MSRVRSGSSSVRGAKGGLLFLLALVVVVLALALIRLLGL